MADTPTLGGVIGDGEDFEEPEENDEPEEDPDGDIDGELAVEMDLALGDDEIDESEEEDSEDDEVAQARKLLSEEIRDLEAAVAKKGNEIASLGNPLHLSQSTLENPNKYIYFIFHPETSINASRL